MLIRLIVLIRTYRVGLYSKVSQYVPTKVQGTVYHRQTMSCEDLCTGDAGLYTCGQGSGPCSLLCVRATTTREVSAVTLIKV